MAYEINQIVVDAEGYFHSALQEDILADNIFDAVSKASSLYETTGYTLELVKEDSRINITGIGGEYWVDDALYSKADDKGEHYLCISRLAS